MRNARTIKPTGVAIVIFWPAAFLVAPEDGNTAAELGQLKGQLVAIEQASIQERCGVQFQHRQPASAEATSPGQVAVAR